MSASRDRFSHSSAHCFGSLQNQPHLQVSHEAAPSLKYTLTTHFSQIQASYLPIYTLSNRGLTDFAPAYSSHDYPVAYSINATTQRF